MGKKVKRSLWSQLFQRGTLPPLGSPQILKETRFLHTTSDYCMEFLKFHAINMNTNGKGLAEIIEKEYGQNINLCYQCKKCSAGCPLIYEMDYTPTQIIHLIRLGMDDAVLHSKTVWLCASCHTCTTRCPYDIDIARVMDAVRITSRKLKIKPQVGVAKFYKHAMSNVKFFGRMYEPLLFLMTNLSTGKPTKDLGLGKEMLKKRKLKIFPSLRGGFAVRGIFSKVKRIEKI